MLTLIKLVEENVNLKPTDGPSNGHREEKQEEKKPEEDEACGSEGKVLISCVCMALSLATRKKFQIKKGRFRSISSRVGNLSDKISSQINVNWLDPRTFPLFLKLNLSTTI